MNKTRRGVRDLLQTSLAWILVVLAIAVGSAAGELIAKRLLFGMWWFDE